MRLNFVKALIVGVCVAGALVAGTSRGRAIDRPTSIPVQWVEFVSAYGSQDSIGTESFGAQTRPVPAVLLETDFYTYLPTQQNVEVRFSYSDQGFGAPVSLYLYRLNRLTGEKVYFNLPSAGSVAPAGTVRDLFGASARPALVRFPELDEFVLFGSGGALGAARNENLPVGQYAYVAEVRDGSGQRILSHSYAMFSVVSEIVNIATDIATSTTWTADKTYLLNKTGVFVREGATLTVQPGTVVYGAQAQKAALIVDRGAKIIAEGTSFRPIIFTTDTPVGERSRGLWGGLILNGRAPMNAPGGEGEGEGNTGFYGGNDPDDSSGILRYVRVEYSGILFSDDNELNGLALQGVGRGTVIDHVQIHMSQDDCIEFFGGTVDAKYVLLTACRDDSLDWVEGWQGNAQFFVVVQRGDDADNGIEADNKETGPDLLPRSNPTIYNLTLIGAPSGGAAESDDAVVLREGTAAKIHNGIFAYFNETHVAMRTSSTFTQADNGNLVVDNNIFWANQEEWDTSSGAINADGTRTRTFITETMRNNRITDPLLVAPLARIGADARSAVLAPDLRPMPNSPALDAQFVKTPPDNGFFDTSVFYLGGVSPYYDWTKEPWTTWSND
jgi:hypothetical protein